MELLFSDNVLFLVPLLLSFLFFLLLLLLVIVIVEKLMSKFCADLFLLILLHLFLELLSISPNMWLFDFCYHWGRWWWWWWWMIYMTYNIYDLFIDNIYNDFLHIPSKFSIEKNEQNNCTTNRKWHPLKSLDFKYMTVHLLWNFFED